MTDLGQAYSLLNEPVHVPAFAMAPPMRGDAVPVNPHPYPQPQESAAPKAPAQSVMIRPKSTNAQPPPSSKPQQQQQVELGYVDQLVSKKKDVAKLILMALVILLALATHNVLDFVMRNYVIDNGLSFRQEIGLRVLYPVLIIFILWNLKAINSSSRS